MRVHPTAIVDPGAELEADVEVKAFTIIEADVQLGGGCVLGPHTVIRSGTTIGTNTQVHTGAVLGEPAQDAKYRGEPTKLVIGKENVIREYVTMHRATGEGNATRMGDGNMLMAYSHVGHNSEIGSGTMIANSAAIGGHCIVEDFAVIGGLVGLHQFVTVGTMAMVGGMSRLTRDVPPYLTFEGNPARARGVNIRGLARHDVCEADRAELKKAYRLLYRSGHNISDALAIIERDLRPTEQIVYLTEFLRRMDAGYAGRQCNPH
jgi:UDP-N-acetylglucosamine acyltransferase